MGFRQAPVIYFSATDEGRLLEVSDFLCVRLGYTREELAGKKCEELYTISGRIFQQTHLFPLLKMEGHAEEIFIHLKTKDGEHVPVLINAERKEGPPAITHYAGIIVSNRKNYEDELIAAKKAAESALSENSFLIKARKELQEHSKLLDRQIGLVKKQNEELREINHVVTHDMQEPVRKLTIFSDMLRTNPGNTDTAEKVFRVARQLKSVLSGLQKYIWLNETPLKPVPIHLSEIVQEVCQEIQADHPGVDMSLNIEKLPVFDGDRDQITVLFHELIQNAFQFRKGDRVELQISGAEIEQNVFRHSTNKYQYAPFISIRVRDEGTGFDPAYKSQVFELFKRLHQETGRGAGLALCRKIAENHRGTISIDSQPEKGTTVNLKIPLAAHD